MKSPYWNTNVGQGWGPQGSAIQQMLARDWQSSKEGFDALGKMGGAIGGGVVGGIQAYNDPGVYGSKTIDADGVPMQVDKFTPGQAARKGFFQNFASIYNGGGSGGDASGIGALMGGSGGKGTPNFKQLQQGGKAADSFREMIKIGMPLAGEQEPNVFGTDDEWKTLSATEKFARVGEAFKAQQFQSAQLAYKQGLQDYAAKAQQMAAAQQGVKANEQIAPWLQSYAEAADQPVPAITTPGPFGGPVAPAMNVGAPPMQAAAAASRKYPLAPTAPQFDNTLSALTRAAQLGAGSTAPSLAFQEDPVSGTRFATYGNSLIPSGVNPARVGQAIPITGPNGENLGVGLPGRSGVTPLPTGSVKDKDKYARLSKQLDSLIKAQGNAFVPAAQAAYQKQIDDVQRQLQALETESGGANVPASQTPPAVGTVVNGYRFKGGNPTDQHSWEQVK